MGSRSVHLDSVGCMGGETALLSCLTEPIGTNDCAGLNSISNSSRSNSNSSSLSHSVIRCQLLDIGAMSLITDECVVVSLVGNADAHNAYPGTCI